MKSSSQKGRSQKTYEHKVKRVTNWYNHLIEERKKEVINPNTKQSVKRKELKDLSFYTDKIKKPNINK